MLTKMMVVSDIIENLVIRDSQFLSLLQQANNCFPVTPITQLEFDSGDSHKLEITEVPFSALYLRTNCTPAYLIKPRMEDKSLQREEERAAFNALFPEIVKDLTESPEFIDMPETNEWLKRVLEYNVPFGKQNRALFLARTYRHFSTELTNDNIKLSYVLGWCVEILLAGYMIADDIMDESETRRGRLCWYKRDGLGATAFNDTLLLQASVFEILKKYFREKDYYLDLIELFNNTTLKSLFGQSLDTRASLEKRLETFSLDQYAAIVKYKTSYISFVLPVSLAMAMAGIRDTGGKSQAESVLLEMGHIFQVQDDYLDCFGDPKITGKVGTDIADCKCSWLVVVALERANAAQRQIIMDNYGHDCPERISKVKQLYIDVGIPQLYLDFEEQSYNTIKEHIDQLSCDFPKKIFRSMIDKIYRRDH